MRGNARSRLQLRRSDLSALALDPQRPDGRPSLVFERSREIHNGASCVPGVFPTAACALLIRGKKREVYVLELLGAHALDKTDLVTHGLQLTERLVVIQQADVGGGKIALVEDLGYFLALQRSGAHNGGAIEVG